MKINTIPILALILLVQTARAQWTTSYNGSPDNRTVVQFSASSQTDVWAVLADPYFSQPVSSFAKTTDGGNTWTTQAITLPGTLQLVSLCALDQDRAWALVINDNDTMGNVLRTTDGGQSWERQDSALFRNRPRWIYFWNADEGVAVGDPHENHFEVLTTANGGTDWDRVPNIEIPVSVGGEYTLTQSFCVTGDSVFFGGYTEGKIFLSPDRGRQWVFIPCPLVETKKVLFRDSLIGIVGKPGLQDLKWDLHLTVDGGLTWTGIDPNGPVFSGDLCWVPGTAGVIVSAGTGISVSGNLGINWKPMDLPDQDPSPFYNAILFHDLTHGWAGGGNPATGTGGMASYSGPAIGLPGLETKSPVITVFPNPSDGRFSIRAGQGSPFPLVLTVRDVSGRTIYTENHPYLAGGETLTLDLERLQPGMYFLQLANPETNIQKQLILK